MSDDHVALYAAEIDAFDGTDLESPRSLDDLQRAAAELVGSDWWRGPAVDVLAARSDARSSSARCIGSSTDEGRGRVQIRLAEPQRTFATLGHELAHALAGPDVGHGGRYRAAYLDVIAVLTNLDPTDRRHELHVVQLRSALAAHGLSVGERSWPEPPAAAGSGAIAL